MQHESKLGIGGLLLSTPRHSPITTNCIEIKPDDAQRAIIIP